MRRIAGHACVRSGAEILEILVRAGQTADVASVVALELRSQGASHWGTKVYRSMLESALPEAGISRVLLIAEVMNHVAGFIVASSVEGAGEVELESVVVAEEMRRRGVGRALCKELLRWAESQGASGVSLEVRASSGAQELYAALGFKQIGRRKGYYREPDEDAVLMRAEL